MTIPRYEGYRPNNKKSYVALKSGTSVKPTTIEKPKEKPLAGDSLRISTSPSPPQVYIPIPPPTQSNFSTYSSVYSSYSPPTYPATALLPDPPHRI
jgi:hypothetical protein